jgi:hypothetical protein
MSKLGFKIIGLLILTSSALGACGTGTSTSTVEEATTREQLASEDGASDIQEESLGVSPQVGNQFELNAHPDGEALDASIYATQGENGSRIDVVGTFRMGKPPLYYHLEFDLKSKTYKALRKDIPSAWLRGQSSANDEGYAPAAIVPGTFYAEAILISEDPPQIDLATTRNYVLWTTYASGAMAINSAYGSCTGYNGTGRPYPTDTHWYPSSCTRGIGSPWAQQINGGYYNYDWGWDTDITTAAHMTKIQPNNNASFTYWNAYSHAGETYWLLQADLFVNGVQQY